MIHGSRAWAKCETILFCSTTDPETRGRFEVGPKRDWSRSRLLHCHIEGRGIEKARVHAGQVWHALHHRRVLPDFAPRLIVFAAKVDRTVEVDIGALDRRGVRLAMIAAALNCPSGSGCQRGSSMTIFFQ